VTMPRTSGHDGLRARLDRPTPRPNQLGGAIRTAIPPHLVPTSTTSTPSRPRTRIRKTVESDGDAIADILRSSADWYESFVDEDDMDQHAVADTWFAENFEEREFWTLERGGEVAGVLTIQDAGRDLYLGYVYVHVDHVGAGLGRKLLEHARRLGWQRGKENLVLLVHPEANWAIRAYEKFGFEPHLTTDEDVLAWNGGWLTDYHESGFHLYRFPLQDDRPS